MAAPNIDQPDRERAPGPTGTLGRPCQFPTVVAAPTTPRPRRAMTTSSAPRVGANPIADRIPFRTGRRGRARREKSGSSPGELQSRSPSEQPSHCRQCAPHDSSQRSRHEDSRFSLQGLHSPAPAGPGRLFLSAEEPRERLERIRQNLRSELACRWPCSEKKKEAKRPSLQSGEVGRASPTSTALHEDTLHEKRHKGNDEAAVEEAPFSLESFFTLGRSQAEREPRGNGERDPDERRVRVRSADDRPGRRAAGSQPRPRHLLNIVAEGRQALPASAAAGARPGTTTAPRRVVPASPRAGGRASRGAPQPDVTVHISAPLAARRFRERAKKAGPRGLVRPDPASPPRRRARGAARLACRRNGVRNGRRASAILVEVLRARALGPPPSGGGRDDLSRANWSIAGPPQSETAGWNRFE